MKVLVPVDGLEASLRAVDYAIKMADSSLVLLNVQDLCIANEFTEVKDIAEQEAAKALKEATDKAEAAGADFKSVVRTGQVAERIVQVARAEDVQHIVMGTRGLGRALGSVEGHPLGGSSDYADQVAVRIRRVRHPCLERGTTGGAIRTESWS
jgi:nucleotide-binding universal stress UspA family protein